MNPNISIVNLHSDQWEHYKRLRLAALKNDPQAFMTTSQEASSYSTEYWKDKLDANTFFAKLGNDYVGMITLGLNHKEKISHVAEIFGVYVDPLFRGQGIGKLLMQAAIDKALSYKFIRKIKLEVVASQKTALNMYTGLGFQKIGILKDELSDNDQFLDTVLMEKHLT